MGSGAGHSDGIRVLVADDEPHIRRILVTLLEAAGLKVEAVADGEAALERLEGDDPFSLALLDIMMPGLTGLEILLQIRGMAHRKALPVIILTAKGQDADREQALQLGATDFLTKPFSPKKLLARIERVLRQS
jgi:DNA-binding response OmpR family regulator